MSASSSSPRPATSTHRLPSMVSMTRGAWEVWACTSRGRAVACEHFQSLQTLWVVTDWVATITQRTRWSKKCQWAKGPKFVLVPPLSSFCVRRSYSTDFFLIHIFIFSVTHASNACYVSWEWNVLSANQHLLYIQQIQLPLISYQATGSMQGICCDDRQKCAYGSACFSLESTNLGNRSNLDIIAWAA